MKEGIMTQVNILYLNTRVEGKLSQVSLSENTSTTISTIYFYIYLFKCLSPSKDRHLIL